MHVLERRPWRSPNSMTSSDDGSTPIAIVCLATSKTLMILHRKYLYLPTLLGIACLIVLTSLGGSTVLRQIYVLIVYDNASASPVGYMSMLMAQAKRMFSSGHLIVEAFLRLPNESIFSALSHTCRKDMPSRCSSMLPGGSRIRKLRSSSVFRRMLRRHVSRVRESCLQKSISVWVVMLSKNRGSGCEQHRYASGLQVKERRSLPFRRL